MEQLPTLATLNLGAVLPVLTLLIGTIILLTADLFIPQERKYLTGWLSAVVVLFAVTALVVHVVILGSGTQGAFSGMLIIDGYALFLQGIFLFTALVGVLVALNYLPRRGIERGEYYTLLLFTTLGMMVMAIASDLIVVFLALELLSIPLYVMSGIARPEPGSEESAMKYFLLGAFSSAFFVYGVALTYGGTGTTGLSGVVANLTTGSAPNQTLAVIGMGLMLVGLGFKVAAAPFHMWTPDVYQGAPTSVTAFMSVGAKAGGFAALLRVLIAAFPTVAAEWGTLVSIIALLTMIIGNVIAISQTDVKRMLAYSSIAHAGYILVAVAAARYPEVAPFAVSSAVFYLVTYAVTNLGAFAVVIALENDDGSGTAIDDFAGLSNNRLVLASIMTLFMLSLTGVPPSAGMVGKFFVFQAAIQAASQDTLLLVVVIIGILTSVVSAFYYMRVVVMMWMREGEPEVRLQPALSAALVITAAGTFLLGIVPGPLFQMARAALLQIAAG